MAINWTLTGTSTYAGDLALTSGMGAQLALNLIRNHLAGGLNGAQGLSAFTWRDTAVAATGTITLASCAAGTVILVNGVPFTAKGSAATTGNNEFDVSGADSADATALAAAINASTTAGIAGVLTASANSATVTVTSSLPGLAGNAITIENLGVVATGTITCAGVDNNDTVTINGVTLTAKTTVSDATIEWAVGATDAATATNLAALINSTATNALITKHVRALARSAVVHLFAKHGGKGGNAITLASSDGTDLAVSGARLTGGTIAQWEGAQALATITISGADGGAYVATVNGVACNATGTNGNDTATATSITAAINSSTDALVQGLVHATSASGVVTIAAVHGGHQGNAITLAATGTGATASATRLGSGAVPTTAVVPATGFLTSGSNDTALAFVL
jgi:hypothetical protein